MPPFKASISMESSATEMGVSTMYSEAVTASHV